jgi:Transposase IS66 family/IS66 C-terminal element
VAAYIAELVIRVWKWSRKHAHSREVAVLWRATCSLSGSLKSPHNLTVEFKCLDITKGKLPDADLCLIRQVMQHLGGWEVSTRCRPSCRIVRHVADCARHQRLSAEERLGVRQEQSAPLLAALEAWLREEHSRLSRSASVDQPIDYMLKRWDRFARFIEDGRVCLTNNAAERALRGFALGRKSWLFAGSERGADRAAAMTTLIMTAKLNDVDPQAWLTDVLGQIADIPQGRLAELLPWNWKQPNLRAAA